MLNELANAVAIFVTLRTSFRAFSGPVNCVKDLIPAEFQFGSPHRHALSLAVSTIYIWCKKMLLNIELAVKIGSRLIESLPLLDFLRRWSEKAAGHDQSTVSRDTGHARTGKSGPTFRDRKTKRNSCARLNEAALLTLVSIELELCPASLTKSSSRFARKRSKHSVHRSSLIQSGSAIETP